MKAGFFGMGYLWLVKINKFACTLENGVTMQCRNIDFFLPFSLDFALVNSC